MTKIWNLARAIFVLAFPIAALFAQRPLINPNGVVNAASYSTGSHSIPAVAGGGIFSIFGQNLAASTQTATGTPLPITLGGTSVTVGGLAAPLFYVSPGQINFQVPSDVQTYGPPSPVIVTTAVGASDPAFVDGYSAALGIFTQNGTGCGAGAIQNIGSDGSVVLNTPRHSASPGSYITIYGTGLGAVYRAVPDGQPAPYDPLARRIGSANVAVGLDGFQHWVYDWRFSGRAPGQVGLDQVNVVLPNDAPEGCAVPLRLLGGSTSSQSVTLSIRRGGGVCEDAAPARFGKLQWKKTITTSPATPAGFIEETFAASFAAAPENQIVPPYEQFIGGCRTAGFSAMDPHCGDTGLSPLDAGQLTLQGAAGGPITLLPTSSGSYATTLPADSVQTGTLKVAGVGGSGVGGFEASLSIPPPIQITSTLPPGTHIGITTPLRVTWTNGSPDAIVRMQVISNLPRYYSGGYECAALATDGQITLNPTGSNPALLPIQPSDNVEVVLIVSPRTPKTVSASGLTRDATYEWSYEYHFKGLIIR